MAEFEYLDHTADFCIAARGESPGSALKAATEGLLEALLERNLVEPREKRCISATGYQRDEAVVNYFNELLYLVEGEMWVVRDPLEVTFEGDSVSAVLSGESFDSSRHQILSEIKAATYHGLRFEETGGVWQLEVIFDV